MLPTDVHSWPSWWQISWRRSWLPRRKLRRLSGKRRHRPPPRHPAESGQRPSAGQGRNQSPTSQHHTSVNLAKFPQFEVFFHWLLNDVWRRWVWRQVLFSEEMRSKPVLSFVEIGGKNEIAATGWCTLYRRTNETVSSLLNHHQLPPRSEKKELLFI